MLAGSSTSPAYKRTGQGSRLYVLHPDQFGSPQLYSTTSRPKLGPSMAEIRRGWPLARDQMARDVAAVGGPFPRRRKGRCTTSVTAYPGRQEEPGR